MQKMGVSLGVTHLLIPRGRGLRASQCHMSMKYDTVLTTDIPIYTFQHKLNEIKENKEAEE